MCGILPTMKEAEEFLRRSIRHSNPDESHLRKAYALLVYAEMRLGRREEALATCLRGRELFPVDAELRALLQAAGTAADRTASTRSVG